MIEYTVKVSNAGNNYWCLNGKLHREDGPAIEFADGGKRWLVNGKRHRTDGPAIEYPDGSKEWYVNGQRHRTDGPAIEGANGDKEWWYLNGVSMTFYAHKAATNPVEEMTMEDICKALGKNIKVKK